jgi:predicted dinucleotide-binding enzyme
LHALDELACGAHPARAFNTLGRECFADPVIGGQRVDLLNGVEEGAGRDVAEQLIQDMGLEPAWLGGPDSFELVDSVTRLWFTLAIKQSLGRHLAFKIIRDT